MSQLGKQEGAEKTAALQFPQQLGTPSDDLDQYEMLSDGQFTFDFKLRSKSEILDPRSIFKNRRWSFTSAAHKQPVPASSIQSEQSLSLGTELEESSYLGFGEGLFAKRSESAVGLCDLFFDKRDDSKESLPSPAVFNLAETANPKEVFKMKNYELQESLANGRLARVFKAKRTADGQSVAVKVYEDGCEARESLLRERSALLAVKATGGKSADRIIDMVETFSSADCQFLVLELWNTDLRRFMKAKRQERLELKHVRLVGRQLMEALAALENVKIVHFDSEVISQT